MRGCLPGGSWDKRRASDTSYCGHSFFRPLDAPSRRIKSDAQVLTFQRGVFRRMRGNEDAPTM
jgi:hypothetical protein